MPVTTPAGEGHAVLKIALGWVGPVQYELIEPVSGFVDHYREALAPDHMPRFHHVGMRTRDWDGLQRVIADSGLPFVFGGQTPETRFTYIDARPLLGHYLEYLEMSDERFAAMGAPVGRI